MAGDLSRAGTAGGRIRVGGAVDEADQARKRTSEGCGVASGKKCSRKGRSGTWRERGGEIRRSQGSVETRKHNGGRMARKVGARDRSERGDRTSTGGRAGGGRDEPGADGAAEREIGRAGAAARREAQNSNASVRGGFGGDDYARKDFCIYESEGNGSRAIDQERGIRTIRRVTYSRDSAAAGDGAGELQRGGASDPAVSAGNGGEAAG